MIKVILDTNFLLDIAKFRIDFISELDRILDDKYELYILDKTINELKNKKNSKLALKLIKNKVDVIKADKGVDESLLELNDCVIATQDKELKKGLKKKGLKTIVIRQKRYLELI